MTRQADALRSCLELHDEALWVLGQIGGRFSKLRAQAQDTFKDQRRARDTLRQTLRRNVQPPPAYDIERPSDAASAHQLMRSVLERQLQAYVVLIGLVEASDRRRWLSAMRTCGLAQLDWGGRPAPFPGLDAPAGGSSPPGQ